MRDDATRLLAEADPIAGLSTEVEAVCDNQDQLIEAILVSASPVSASHKNSRLRGRTFQAGFAVVATCVIVFAVILLGTGSDHQGGKAYGAELVAFAEASPLVLIDLPDWRVAFVDEQDKRYGYMSFVNWPKNGSRPRPRISVDMEWSGRPLAKRLRRLSRPLRKVASDVPVLGSVTDVYTYGRSKTGIVLSSVFESDGRTLEIRTDVPNLNAYKNILSGLRKVDVDTWLDAMPPSVISRFDRPDAVAEMLKGIPLPPDFDPSSIRGADLTKSKYSLGVNVAGTVTCDWFDRWSEALRRGDEPAATAAISAMSTSKTWPVLKMMAKRGGYPKVIWAYSDAMQKGTTLFGRPLEKEVERGLGCQSLGVDSGPSHPSVSTSK